MIIEYTWSKYDLKKDRCFGCDWLKMNDYDGWTGYCECPHNKVKIRNRQITNKKCTQKVMNYLNK